MRRSRRVSIARAVLCALATALPAARTTLAAGTDATTDPRLACVEASERGQTLRDQRHLGAARASFLSCVRPVCPDVVRRDCTAWLASVDASLPTVVLRAVAPDGHDLVAVRVRVDGAPLLDKLDGSAVPLDPGTHAIVASSDGLVDVEQEVLVVQGEKNRILFARFAEAAPRSAGEPSRASVATGTWIFGGVAVAALASFAGFGIAALDKKSDIDSTCAPTHSCTQSDKSALFGRALGADLSLGAAVVSAGIATFLQWKHGAAAVAPVDRGAMASWTLRY